MRRTSLPFLAVLLLTSCGAYQWLGDSSVQSTRQIASAGVKQITQNPESFDEILDEKLQSLYSYYLIGQKNLEQFDLEASDLPLEKLYESQSYLNLIAVRTQAEAIEEELHETWEELNENKSKVLGLKMKIKIRKFAEKSPYAFLSMQNLSSQMNMELIAPPHFTKFKYNKRSLENELKELESNKEFRVYEKNVEHLSHVLDIKVTNQAKKFYPTKDKAGNIFGGEFPAKVWSLTFDDGPGKVTTAKIVKSLQERNLPATFFQLTRQVSALPQVAKAVREAGMEIASHSYTHQQLTKVGGVTLEKEITGAVADLKKLHGREIKFFRLPYGAGVNSSHIREKIAQNNLIHVFWNIDTLDWMPQGPDKIVSRTLALMKKTPKDAGVILFHDIHDRTTKAAPEIMDYLKKDGRRVCTLDEIVTQMNEGAQTVCPLK